MEDLIQQLEGALTMRTSNKYSYGLSILSVLLLIANIIFSGYIVSLNKNEIDENRFHISQALAHGNEIALITLIVITFIVLAFLLYYRKYSNWFFVFKLILLLSACVFLITIIYITTYRDVKLHYIFAIIIFLCMFLFLLLNSIDLWRGKKNKTNFNKFFIILVPLLSILSVIGLGLGVVYSKQKSELFPIFENINVVVFSLSLLLLGFI